MIKKYQNIYKAQRKNEEKKVNLANEGEENI